MAKKSYLDTLIGTRVFVSDGDNSRYLGEGAYLGYVRTFYFQYQNGISSDGIKNPEKMPTEGELLRAYKRGGVLRTFEKMPKIKLDSGKIIYGMDCWWRALKDPANFDTEKEDFISKMHRDRKDSLTYELLKRQYKRHEITLAAFKAGLRKHGVKERNIPKIIASANGIRVLY